jgi:hypothetical protein
MAMNGLLRGGAAVWLGGLQASPLETLRTVAAVPFPLILVLGVAARAALALPMEPKANWIFRMTARDAIRVDQLRAAETVVIAFAVLIPVALVLPIQWLVAGPRAIAASAFTAIFGFLWVEALLRGWRRIPFTCSYTPGKYPLAQSCLIGLSIFAVVTTVGSAVEFVILRGMFPAAQIPLLTATSLLTLILRRRRRTKWEQTPLDFDDRLPSDIEPLSLSER